MGRAKYLAPGYMLIMIKITQYLGKIYVAMLM